MLPQKPVNYSPIKSLSYAVAGIRLAFSRESNLSIQAIIGITVCVIGIATSHTIAAMACLVMMGVVISFELVNSALETLCDLVTVEYNEHIKDIKDMAAGAVLITAIIWGIILVYTLMISLFDFIAL
jgi:diacylglycerol kinase (ATP)